MAPLQCRISDSGTAFVLPFNQQNQADTVEEISLTFHL